MQFNTLNSRISGIPRTAPLNYTLPAQNDDNFDNTDLKDYTGYLNAENRFRKLKSEQEALENYKKRLYDVHKDLNMRQGKTLSSGMKDAYEKVDQILEKEFIIHPEVIDPLIAAYERKCALLEQEAKESKTDVKKLSQVVIVLVDDNTKLRDIFAKKESDIQQLITTDLKHQQALKDSFTNEILLLKKQITDLQTELENCEFKDKTGQIHSDRFKKEKEELLSICDKYQIEAENEKKQKRGLIEEKVQLETAVRELREKVRASDGELLDIKQQSKELRISNQTLTEEKNRLERLINDGLHKNNEVDTHNTESIKQLRTALDEQIKIAEMLKAENDRLSMAKRPMLLNNLNVN